MELIKEALRPNFWRPVTDNDMGNGMNKTLRPWRDAGRQAKLLSMKQKALGKEVYEVVSQSGWLPTSSFLTSLLAPKLSLLMFLSCEHCPSLPYGALPSTWSRGAWEAVFLAPCLVDNPEERSSKTLYKETARC